MHLLHLEDNVTDAELVAHRLKAEWPDCLITRVDTRDDFLAALQSNRYQLILSDFSLPTFNGLEALALTRQHDPSLIFIFLSGTIGEHNAVEALRRGAVDYVIKDRPTRLIPAIKRALADCEEQRLRRLHAQRLREQAELLDKAQDAICVTDIEGQITYWNQAATRLFGWHSAGGEITRSLPDLFIPPNENLLPEALRELHGTGQWTREMQLGSGPQGSVLRHVISRWTMVRDADGQPKSILIINTDISELKKLETQLLRAQRMDGIGTFAGGVAHDLNNVLTPILISANLLQLKLADDELLQLVSAIERKALDGASLLRQVQAFAHGTDGERQVLRPEQLISEAVTQLDQSLPPDIEIQTDVSPGVWPILANPTQVSQILLNMGVNAREAMMDGGRISFRASNFNVNSSLAQAYPGVHAGPYVLLTVEDNGRGIPEPLIERIFDPFFTTKVNGKGAGLGLSVVLGILRSYGGFMQVKSQVGLGTEFRLFFPAAVDPQPLPPTGSALAPRRGNGETVLVIDDQDEVRALLRELLESHNYRVITARSGEEGLDCFRDRNRDIRAVLIDLMRPGLFGEAVISELKSIDPDVRIVAMSSLERSRHARDFGRLTFLPKPMRSAELTRALQSVLPPAGRR